MSTEDLIPGGQPQQPTTVAPPVQVWRGVIDGDPTSVDEQVHVKIAGADNKQHRHGPCPFVPIGSNLPARGDRCVVVFDEDGDPTIVWWEPQQFVQGWAVGDIKLTARASLEVGWLWCDNEEIAAEHIALIEQLELQGNPHGTGPNGRPRTPNTKDRFPLGVGDATDLGDTGGEEEVTLTIDQMPEHTHQQQAVSLAGYGQTSPIFGNAINPTTQNTGAAGGDEPHNNMPPWVGLNFVIKT